MRYRIEQLANASQISVDTIRYYQNLKLLAPPVRDGRVGWYKESHLRRLQEVQELSQHGFTLEQIRELDNYDPLLRVLASKSNSDKTYTAAQLAHHCGLDQDLVDAAIEVGLIQPLASSRTRTADKTGAASKTARFGGDAAEMLTATAALIEAGVDAGGLFELALEHARHTQSSVEKAVQLFVDAAHENELSKTEIAGQLEQLLPLVVKLVARHFSQTLLEYSSKLVYDGSNS